MNIFLIKKITSIVYAILNYRYSSHSFKQAKESLRKPARAKKSFASLLSSSEGTKLFFFSFY